MKTRNMNLNENDHWGLKEFILLLLLEFVIGVGIIKFVIKPIYELWIGHELYALALMGITIAITLLLGIYFIALRPKKLPWSDVGLRKFALKDWKSIFLYSIILLVGTVIIVLITSFLGNSIDNSKTDTFQQDVTTFTFLITFISAAIISPIYEEIFYRGFIYRWLRTRVGLICAIHFSSSMFTAIHIPIYNTMHVNFFSGIIFALTYEKTNSIWPVVIVHGSTYGIMVLLTALGQEKIKVNYKVTITL